MKRFMQLFLSTFGIMALVLAGCSTEEGTTGVEEDAVEDEEVTVDVDATVDGDDAVVEE